MTDTFISQAVNRCLRVAAGADELIPLFGSVMPFQGDDLNALELVERAAAIAFLKRFEQLQDLIGRTARAIAGWSGVDADEMTHRDVGDWLEKRLIIEDATAWMVTVRLRNRLVHEYPIEEGEQVARLNDCWKLMPLLRDATQRLCAYAGQKGLSS